MIFDVQTCELFTHMSKFTYAWTFNPSQRGKNIANRDEIFLLVFVFDDMMTTTIMLFPIYMEGGKYQLRGSVTS